MLAFRLEFFLWQFAPRICPHHGTRRLWLPDAVSKTPLMKRILIVDDSPAARSLVAAALNEPETLSVERISSGIEALKRLSTEDFDLVVTDVNMPDLSGLELIRFIKQNERLRHLPVLVISTDTTEQDRARALALGADDYLAKPFTPEQLRRTIEKVTGDK